MHRLPVSALCSHILHNFTETRSAYIALYDIPDVDVMLLEMSKYTFIKDCFRRSYGVHPILSDTLGWWRQYHYIINCWDERALIWLLVHFVVTYSIHIRCNDSDFVQLMVYDGYYFIQWWLLPSFDYLMLGMYLYPKQFEEKDTNIIKYPFFKYRNNH